MFFRVLKLILLASVILSVKAPVVAQTNTPQRIAQLGRGTINGIALSPDAKTLAINGSAGIWLYTLADLGVVPRLLASKNDPAIAVYPPRQIIPLVDNGSNDAWDVQHNELGGGAGCASTGGDYSSIPTGFGFGTEIAFSSDGSQILTQNRALAFDDVQTGKVTPVLDCSGSGTFSADGKHLITPDAIWDIATHKKLFTFPATRQSANSSPDGRLFVVPSTGQSSLARMLWDSTSNQSRPLPLAFDGPSAFSPDDKLLALSALSDNTVHLIDTTNGTEVGHMNGAFDGRFPFSSDGKLLALIPDPHKSTIQIWDVAAQKVQSNVMLPDGQTITDVAFSPDSQTIGITVIDDRSQSFGSADNVYRLPSLWDVSTGRLKKQLDNDAGTVDTRVEFTPQGIVLTVDGFSTVHLWNMSSGALLGTINGYKNGVTDQLAFNGSQELLMTTSDGFTSTVHAWGFVSNQERLLTFYAGAAGSFIFSSQGGLFAGPGLNNNLSVWRVSPTLTEFPIATSNNEVVFSPDGKQFAVHEYRSSLIRVAATQTIYAQTSLDTHATSIGTIQFSPDGTLLAVEIETARTSDTVTKIIQLWSVAAKRIVIQTPKSAIGTFVFSADSSWLAVINTDQTISVWGTANGQQRKFTFTGASPFPVFITPDNKWLLLLDSVKHPDQKLALNLPVTGRALTLDLSTTSPDGKFFVFHNHLWDATTDTALTDLGTTNILGLNNNSAFSPDGRLLAVGSDAGTVDIWQLKKQPQK